MKCGLLCCLFTGAAWSQDVIALHTDQTTVPRYSRIEFTLDMAPCIGNPFDPAEVDVTLDITTPAGEHLALPCFYSQDYERSRPGESRDWFYPVGTAGWRARFAPGEVGTYSCVAVRTCRGEAARSEEVRFECTPSDSKGFVRVSATNPRYFAYADGSPCFLIGQNLAFVKDTFRQEELLRKLGAAGGNFARVWACCIDWGMSLDGRKSAWGRSWAWDPPLVAEPGGPGFDSQRLCVKLASGVNREVEVSPSHPVPLRPDTAYVLTGRARTGGEARLLVRLGDATLTDPPIVSRQWTPFQPEFTTRTDQWWLGRLLLQLDGEGAAWISDLSLREAAGGAELLWEADPNRPVLGEYNLVDCAMLDTVVEAAEAAGVHLQLVVFPRDPYWEMHPCLKRGGQDGPDYDRAIRDGRNLLRYAVARWGYSTSVGVWEYFNEIDPESPTDRFYDELGAYLEEIDIYRHPRATSAWGPSPKDWRQPRLDAINLHHYMRPVEGEPWQDEVATLFAVTREAKAPGQLKPILMGEFGLADERWGLSPYQEQDANLVHLHNANWAAALSGLAGSVMPWWWDELDRMDVCRLFPPLAAFVADIPYTTGDLQPFVRLEPEAPVRVVGLRGTDSAYLWIANPQATWYRVAVEKAALSEVRDATVSVDDLAPGTYTIEWWDTRTGEVTQGPKAEHNGGTLSLTVPAFTTDVACKLRKQG